MYENPSEFGEFSTFFVNGVLKCDGAPHKRQMVKLEVTETPMIVMDLEKYYGVNKSTS